MQRDRWAHRCSNMVCSTCMWFASKKKEPFNGDVDSSLGRCRRHAPTMGGFPPVFTDDWCGDHRLDENAVVVGTPGKELCNS